MTHSRHKVALIDDEIQIIEALERLLRKQFEVYKYHDPISFIQFIEQHPEHLFSVIISDQKMPKMNGTELLKKSLELQPQATRILLTGYSELDSIISAINEGHIYRYLHKPWEPHDLIATVSEAAQKYQLILDNEKKTSALEKANEDLKILDKTKNQFMVLINHELKTPLTGIISYLDLLKETQPNEEQQQYLNQIYRNSQRLYKMIQDSLLIISSESHHLNPEIKRFDPQQDLDLQISSEFEQLKKKKNLTLQTSLGSSQWVGDPKILSQVLRRLIENALRFAVTNSEIILKTQQEQPHRCRVIVTNQGPPVPEETLKNLGVPFFISEDMMKHSQGTGLGLSVVVSLLKRHRTEFYLENIEPYVHASFTITTL
jgi:two-component system, sensor histidine kinase and response regulator